jgi:ubiquinone/menaquinone biosynthesis C-methylase UbiE
MDKKKFNYESTIFAWGTVNFSFANAGRPFLVNITNQMKKAGLSSKDKISVLDIGCGAGGLSRAIKRLYPESEYWACDISNSAINIANKKKNGTKYFIADAEKITLRRQFDVIIMNSVLDHLKNPKAAINNVHKLLKSKGIFVSITPVELDFSTVFGVFNKFEKYQNHRRKQLGHVHPFSKKTLAKFLEKGGFKIVNTTYDWFYFYQLVNLFYYVLIELLGKEPDFSVHKYSYSRKGTGVTLLRIFRKTLILLENIESEITRYLPLGYFACITAIKNEKK